MTLLRRMSRRRAAVLLVAAAVAIALVLALSSTPGEASAKTVVPYLELSDAQSAGVATQAPAAGVRSTVAGFIVASGNSCTPRWDGAGRVSSRPFARDLSSLRRAGVHVALSFGGQQGTELALVCRSPQSLAAAYSSAARAYGLKNLDVDLEGGGLDTATAMPRRMAALRLLQRQDPSVRISLTLPVDPTGLPSDALAAVRAAIGAGVRLSRVNVMAFDFGDSSAPHPQGRMAFYVRSAGEATHRQLARLGHGLGAWRALSVTAMIGMNDTVGEVFTLADAHTIARWAKTTHVGELRYWSFNRDRACSGSVSGAQDNCSGVAQQPGEFARALRG